MVCNVGRVELTRFLERLVRERQVPRQRAPKAFALDDRRDNGPRVDEKQSAEDNRHSPNRDTHEIVVACAHQGCRRAISDQQQPRNEPGCHRYPQTEWHVRAIASDFVVHVGHPVFSAQDNDPPMWLHPFTCQGTP